MKPEHLKLLADKDWRLNNLYWITDKEGKPTRFRMTPEQREYFEGIHTRNIILKARQLGFTTEVCIIQLDAALFESAKCALIAHTLNDAKRLFREKVKYAYDKLPAEIKAANPASNDSSGELVFKKGGSLYVSTSFRGGTLRYLHVSEFGKICAKYPDKAREIVTGAFEAVSTGCFATIESTAEGRAGYFFDYCQTAEKALLQGKPLSALDWKFFFFSWWKNPQYAIDPVEPLPQRLVEVTARLVATRLRRALVRAQRGPGGVDEHAAIADLVVAEQPAEDRVVPGLGQLVVQPRINQADVRVLDQGPLAGIQQTLFSERRLQPLADLTDFLLIEVDPCGGSLLRVLPQRAFKPGAGAVGDLPKVLTVIIEAIENQCCDGVGRPGTGHGENLCTNVVDVVMRLSLEANCYRTQPLPCTQHPLHCPPQNL